MMTTRGSAEKHVAEALYYARNLEARISEVLKVCWKM